MQVNLRKLKSCLFTVVCPYMMYLGVLTLYFGNRMLNSRPADDPPYYLMPRMLFMLSVAILVERTGGRLSCLRTDKSIFFKVSRNKSAM